MNGSRSMINQKERGCRAIRLWLYSVLLLCVIIVIVGGATRLTGSGLSITQWKPIHGVIPPIGFAQWQEEFERYQKISQYKLINNAMTLSEFKTIFWWEWTHRLLARLVGLVALFGFLSVWLLQRIERRVLLLLFTVPVLIALQGVVGWWMVVSGLGDSTLVSVSQYRLAIHLVIACTVVVFVTALAFALKAYEAPPASIYVQRFAGLCVFLILVQIYFGALVAGLHAGKVYNSWPLMDGQIWPQGLLDIQPYWHNFFENPLTVQFVHRCFAYALLIVVSFHAFQTRKASPNSPHARRAHLLALFLFIQATLGIITLLLRAPILWSLIHQCVALFILCFATAHWRATKGSLSAPSSLSIRTSHFM
ncbi:COX15/CtaA family protein [Bartonella sp. DGB2]|uniref:COX15/CtaA family protein n=1 Tax=Bartonella sp. DGB2 TaxID=3388426 RepID=UPI00398FF063